MKNKDRLKSNPALSVGFPLKEQIIKLLPKRFPFPKDDEILMCPLGGVGEIGMNWTLYGHAGRWVLVDAGIAFARDYPSIEAIFIDPATFEEIRPLIDAMILTHAHEDHVGAIHRVWGKVGLPIYATPFAADFLSRRLTEAHLDKTTEIRLFEPGDTINLPTFEIQTVHLTHSVPECVGLVFKTPAGNVFHTGDWKFDDNPVVGKPTDKAELKRIGDAGVLALVCDSTNADRPGRATSEGELLEAFTHIMRDHRKSVIVTCFASAVARIASVMKAADAANRYVALAGRSMETMQEIARNQGMLDGIHDPIRRNHLSMVDDYQRVLLCTGTQGEPRAMLAKLSENDPDLKIPKIEPGDVVVFSSSVIPGNEDGINRVKDGLREQGAIIIEGNYKGLPIAASGHAKADEIAEMNALIRPRYLVPVHGTAEHMAANADIALKAGAESAVEPKLGQVLSISQRGIDVVARVEVLLMAQYATGPWDPPIFGVWNDAVAQGLREQDVIVAQVG